MTANELTNGVINAAFMLLFKDLIRLFACYNDGIINLLGKQILLSSTLKMLMKCVSQLKRQVTMMTVFHIFSIENCCLVRFGLIMIVNTSLT